MDTLFLFVKNINESGCVALKINSEGTLITPPKQCTFEEIKALQNNCDTLVIETSDQTSFFNLELPWLPERKARAAIPYALEDKLAQSVDELHCSFDRARYQNNQYLITVISKQRILYLMNLLQEYKIQYSAITLDWFALAPNELCFYEATLLINTNEFKGALKGELTELYLEKHPDKIPITFTDSPPSHSKEQQTKEQASVWIAQRIRQSKVFNLCQGEMQQGTHSRLLKTGAILSAVLFCFWLASLLLVNAIYLHQLNKQTNKIDDQIAVIYHDFFPQSQKVISPKFRITQLLKGNDSEEQNRFWFLFNHLAATMKNNTSTLEQLRFQNKTLSITLISNDFASLELLENEFKKNQLKVKQTQASTHEQQVFATLELT